MLLFVFGVVSQENFWHVPTFKRAMTCVFFVRYVLGHKSQRQWKNFSMDDFKFNTRTFKRWVEKESEVFRHSAKFQGLPRDLPSDSGKRRAESNSEVTSDTTPMKRRFVVQDDSTSEED
jgi:hypothetical protein